MWFKLPSLDYPPGNISSNVMSIRSSLSSVPPTVTLTGVTEGGPPTNYTWRRNGVVITDDDPEYSISIAVTANTNANRLASGYTSTLVTYLPGDYQYSVTNRATATPLVSNATLGGNLNSPAE